MVQSVEMHAPALERELVALPDFEPPASRAKKLKRMLLSGARSVGGFALAKASAWRRQRLLVLAYHGISLHDEHLWDSSLFISPERFTRRMELLRRQGYTVLSLTEGLERAAAGDLPPASVALTFDDGLYCFYKTALPILESFGYASTLYLTTFYSEVQAPVFDVALPYILWKSQGATLNLAPVTGRQESFNLRDDARRAAAWAALRQFAAENHFSAAEKQRMLESVSALLGFNDGALRRERLFNLMTPEETADASRRGVDIELHTHRHRVPLDRELFLREIDENRARIERMTGRTPRHFCYPSGVYNDAFYPWLKERGVISATTCEVGLTSRKTPPLVVPRLVDVSALQDNEFEGWLCGFSSVLPQTASLG
jgi:peptidoglycan/xylan/chitin deacetylase (PgdA/CDA1 family)